MTLPPEVARAVERHLGGEVTARRVGGGCIHAAFAVRGAGGAAFLKLGGDHPPEVLQAEARGLEWLGSRAAGTPRVPEVIAEGEGWLLLEWLEPAPASEAGWRALGGALATLHRATGPGWGWERDGFIGSLPQDNRVEASWAAFWLHRRLEPQRKRAEESGLLPGSSAEWEALAAELPGLLSVAEEEGPSPLHGDLWGGNAHPIGAGEVALVDPAPYRGHREVDLAMARLFGGFPNAFFDAYAAVWPLQDGVERRRACYQLYYLLVHLNLFGSGYAPGTAQALHEALGG